VKKPTRAECLAWAEADERQAEEYHQRSLHYQEEGHLEDARFWANSASTRLHEAKSLREFAKRCD
jgi:hypothetical protein